VPNPGLEKPIRKVTLNLWERDVVTLKEYYGQGYTTVIRDLVEDHARGIARSTPKTIGDLA
jgi:hypothetical protein